MKRVLVSSVLSVVLLGSAVAPRVQAGQGEWATVGKILTAVAAVSILSRALEPVPVYHAAPVYYVPQPVAPVVYQQPVVYSQVVVAPAPVYYAPAPVYYAPAPVVYMPPPVVYMPAPVYYAPRPVYYAPRPIIGISFGSSHHHAQRHHHQMRRDW